MLPTFSINIDKQNKRTLKKIGELLKDVNNSDLTREWAGEAFLKLSENRGVVDLNKYAMACEKNNKIAKKKKGLKEQSILTPEDVEKGYVGVVDIVSENESDSMDAVIQDVDLNYYVNYFLDVREKIFFDKGKDIWRLLVLSKDEDIIAQQKLKRIMNDPEIKKSINDTGTDFRDALYYVLTKNKCFSILEGFLC